MAHLERATASPIPPLSNIHRPCGNCSTTNLLCGPKRVFCQSEELTINRTAAILRNPGSSPLNWHTDFCGFSDGPPTFSGDILNRGPWPSGLWFYITGSHPKHGGLAVIEDSHVEDWEGPEGFQLTPDQRSFHRIGTEPSSHVGFDVPGLVPLFTEPGDEIVFASRTYHSAFPNRIDRVPPLLWHRPAPARIPG